MKPFRGDPSFRLGGLRRDMPAFADYGGCHAAEAVNGVSPWIAAAPRQRRRNDGGEARVRPRFSTLVETGSGRAGAASAELVAGFMVDGSGRA